MSEHVDAVLIHKCTGITIGSICGDVIEINDKKYKRNTNRPWCYTVKKLDSWGIRIKWFKELIA
jgi:hypothetical protein